MKNSKQNFNSAGQSTNEVKRSQKHDANLQKNSTLYFQIGLILCLLGTYSLFEMQFQDKEIVVDVAESNDPATFDLPVDYRLEVVEKKKAEPKVERSTTLIDDYKEVDNDTPDLEKEIFTPDAPDTTDKPYDPSEIEVIEPPKDPVLVDFVKVEVVPIYPGCERKKTNEDKRKCMSDKITKLIHKKFNTSIAGNNGISGLQRIHTQFTVDKTGNVTDIKVLSAHSVLEKEARRVINKIPSMQPGYQGKNPVGVIYTLPIVFEARQR